MKGKENVCCIGLGCPGSSPLKWRIEHEDAQEKDGGICDEKVVRRDRVMQRKVHRTTLVLK